MLSGKNILNADIDGTTGLTYAMVIYKASGTQLFWMDYDNVNYSTVSLGDFEVLGSLTGLPEARTPRGKVRTKRY